MLSQFDRVTIASTSVLAAAFPTLAIIDLAHQLLPDNTVLPGILAGPSFAPFLGHLNTWDGALGAVAGFLLFLPIWLRAQLPGPAGQIMGLGDRKFSAMPDAALGLQFRGGAVHTGVRIGGLAAVGRYWTGHSTFLPEETVY